MHDAVLDPSDPATPCTPAVPFAPAQTVAAHEQPLQFDGQSGEYFRIWIVNIALTLLTLGVYSAWAKVRTQRYFYANTRLDGLPFEYLAQPLPILRGRIVGALLFAAYLLTAQLAPVWNLAVIGLIVVLTPFIVLSGLRFRARYSAWRGLSFRFDGTRREAYALYLYWMLPVLLTMGVLYPWLEWRQQGWIARGHHYGGQRFSFDAELGSYYGRYALAYAAIVVCLLGFVGSIAVLGVAGESLGLERGDGSRDLALGVIFTAAGLFYVALFGITIALRAALANVFWNHVQLGPHRFESRLRPHQVVWIYFGNAAAVLASAGLLIPWAKIRLARYRAACFSVIAAGPLDAFTAEARRDESATGAEVGDIFDIDLSI